MLWINFLHCYQPVNTDAYHIEEATEKSYARIIKAIEKQINIKFTLNINGSLFLRWEELGYSWLIDKIAVLLKQGRIELTGSACYHPLLPLITEAEVRKQISENEEILCKHFGSDFKARGFFMSEMAYSEEAARIVRDFGYEWIILDEIALGGKLGEHDFSKIYKDKASGLKVVFRDRKLSSSFVPETLRDLDNSEYPLITATDGELYGLRHIDPTCEFEKFLKNDSLQTQTVSMFIDNHQDLEEVDIVACSWESLPEELLANKPYILWDDKDKLIQQKLWNLARFSYDIVESNLSDENYNWARWHLVRGFASCTFWWASEKDFSHIYGPYAWSPDEIERGINELIRAVRTLDDVLTRDAKIKAEEMYIDIKKNVWEKHWNYYWKRGVNNN